MKKQRQTAATASQSPQSDRIRWQPTPKHIRAQQSSGSRSRLLFFACSGNGNGQSWNNRGSNGNYWSRSLNSQTNGRNLNFNSGGVNPQNNNNRFNGFARRAVQHSSLHRLTPVTGTVLHGNHSHDESRLHFFIIIMSDTIIQTTAPTGYRLTRQQLLYDLYVAYYDAARHKHKMSYVEKFERNLAENLNELCDDLMTRRYEAQPSKCFRSYLS